MVVQVIAFEFQCCARHGVSFEGGVSRDKAWVNFGDRDWEVGAALHHHTKRRDPSKHFGYSPIALEFVRYACPFKSLEAMYALLCDVN